MTRGEGNTLDVRDILEIDGKKYTYFSLPKVSKALGNVDALPFSLKIVLENLLRNQDGKKITIRDIESVVKWLETQSSTHEIFYHPARILMQDFTGVPALVDLAALRDATLKLKGDGQGINPFCPVDLVIDHSVMVDYFGDKNALEKNVSLEFKRNYERYAFLRWGQKAFKNFRVIPPGTGICHQVNIEYLAKVVRVDVEQKDHRHIAYLDTCVGTDSHTTMVNALGVLGWGVGGIEAEAVMLGQPISMLLPQVVGFKLTNALTNGVTATDLVLTITEILRKENVVGKFVEFFGEGLDSLSLADRATISNMAPEYGATCGIFPIDKETLKYLHATGRSQHQQDLVEAYAKHQGMWRGSCPEAKYTRVLHLDVSTIQPSVAGPKRPQDRVILQDVPRVAKDMKKEFATETQGEVSVSREASNFTVKDNAVVIAAITSCTNTSNPDVLIGAGLLAKKAVALGLSTKPWVKTSFAPGSQVVADYLDKAGLIEPLSKLGFDIVGYGCTTCIGNSGPLPQDVAEAINKGNLLVNAVLSGNRNFEGRINPQTRGNWLASPLLVVAYALAGTMEIDFAKDPIAKSKQKQNVYLKDLWPTNAEIEKTVQKYLTPEMFRRRYASVFTGTEQWQNIDVPDSVTYMWEGSSTYIQNPPYFDNVTLDVKAVEDIRDARPLLVLGDSITTDHISPAGSFKADTPAGAYLLERNVQQKDFNSFGARRGNHEVMVRGTFSNIRIHNELVPGKEGGYTVKDGKVMSVYDAAMQYAKTCTPLCVFAGKEYGTGSSRDWAAKGTRLLGIQFVVAESFERIHRSNLVGMGVLPLMFKEGMTRKDLSLKGTESISITGLTGKITPKQVVKMTVVYEDGKIREVELLSCIYTAEEIAYYENGGILQYVLHKMLGKNG